MVGKGPSNEHGASHNHLEGIIDRGETLLDHRQLDDILLIEDHPLEPGKAAHDLHVGGLPIPALDQPHPLAPVVRIEGIIEIALPRDNPAVRRQSIVKPIKFIVVVAPKIVSPCCRRKLRRSFGEHGSRQVEIHPLRTEDVPRIRQVPLE